MSTETATTEPTASSTLNVASTPVNHLSMGQLWREIVWGFYLAKASGFDPLTALLRKLGVPGPALRTALQVLEIEQRHKIPNMTLTQDHFRELGL